MSAARRKRQINRAAVEPKSRSGGGSSSVSTQSTTSGGPLSLGRAIFGGRALWVSLALIVVTVIVYAPVWHYGFVSADDPQYVSQNPNVLRGLTWQGVTWAFTSVHASYWIPLTWLSYMLDVRIYGTAGGGFHVTNVLFHIVNVIVLFGLLYRMTGALGRSAFVAGLFAVHPLHVESVAWVTERKDVLSTLFGLLSLWAYVVYIRQPRLGRYLLVALFLALGLMAKPMLVTLPLVLLLLDIWPLGRLRFHFAHQGRSGADRASQSESRMPSDVRLIGRLAVEKLPLLSIAVASSIITVIVQHVGVAALDEIPLHIRVENALVSYVAYIGQMLWPTGLAAFYPYPRSIPMEWVLGSILFLMGVSWAVIRRARRHPYLLVGWLWYLGTLAPVIGLVQTGGQARADRFTYVPLIGLFLMLGWGIPELLARWPDRSIALPVTAGVALLGCAIAARSQVQYWSDSEVLWRHALEVTTENYFAHTNLGVALAKQGRVGEAIAHYSEAVRIQPDFADAHNKLGIALADQGRIDEAITHYTEALRWEPDFPEAHNNLGNALATQGKVNEALAQYSEALRMKPDFALAHTNLGSALKRQGKVSEAIAHYTEALRLEPDLALAHNNLGVALASQGKVSEAIAHYLEALRINPDYELAHNNLGLALANQGRVDEAVQQFSETLRINPSHPGARRALDDLRSRGKISEPVAR